MNRLRVRGGLMLVVFQLVSLGVCAESDEARLKREKQEIELRHAQAVEACRHEFAATACLDRARAERRAAMDEWRQQRLVIDDAKRRTRAAQRLQEIQSRNAELDARVGSAVDPPRAASAPASRDGAARKARPPASASSDARAAQVSEQAAKASAQRRQREREAAEHRAAVEKRNAESAARRASSPGLPVPPAAPAASAVSPAARP